MAMHHFYLRLPSSVSHLDEDFRRMLGDTDPGVMEGALVLFHQLVKVGGAGAGQVGGELYGMGLPVCVECTTHFSHWHLSAHFL